MRATTPTQSGHIQQDRSDLASPSRARQLEWDAVERTLSRAVDGLGRGIEAGVFPVVHALNVFGVQTRQSCEGHSAGNGGNSYTRYTPWVEIAVGRPDFEPIHRGEREALDRRLASIPVADSIRRTLPVTANQVGWSYELFRRTDGPLFRLRNQSLWSLLSRTVDAVRAEFEGAPLTPEEARRRADEQVAFDRLRGLLTRFEAAAPSSPDERLVLRGRELVVGLTAADPVQERAIGKWFERVSEARRAEEAARFLREPELRATYTALFDRELPNGSSFGARFRSVDTRIAPLCDRLLELRQERFRNFALWLREVDAPHPSA